MFFFIADKSNSWLRFRYGRLSVDSDDQNFNNKCVMDIDDDDDDVLVEYKVDTKCCDKINSNAGSQCLDANGNQVNDKNQNENNDKCDCVGVEIDSQMKNSLSETNSIHQLNENIVNKLQTISLSDYGKFFIAFLFSPSLISHASSFVIPFEILLLASSKVLYRLKGRDFFYLFLELLKFLFCFGSLEMCHVENEIC